jgi:hypothetical protein
MAETRTINDIIERFRLNWQGYVRRYWIFLVLTFFAATADMFSTIYFMHFEGMEIERHPTIRLLSLFLGPVLGPVVGKLWQLVTILVVTVYLRRWAAYIFVTVIILYFWAAWYNIWGRFLYYPLLIEFLDHLPG